jgi:hypothetical protein
MFASTCRSNLEAAKIFTKGVCSGVTRQTRRQPAQHQQYSCDAYTELPTANNATSLFSLSRTLGIGTRAYVCNIKALTTLLLWWWPTLIISRQPHSLLRRLCSSLSLLDSAYSVINKVGFKSYASGSNCDGSFLWASPSLSHAVSLALRRW